MPSRLLNRTGSLFDQLEQRWEKLATQRRIASALVVVFVAGLALTAPRVFDAGLGVAATLFAIALTWVYNRTSSPDQQQEAAAG